MGSESADPTDQGSEPDWQEAVRELFASPVQLLKDPLSRGAVNGKTRRSHLDQDLSSGLRALLEASHRGARDPFTWGALYQLLRSALDHGDDTDPARFSGGRIGSATALREGARGTLFLAGRNTSAVPTTQGEIDLVNATRDPIGQARRWAAIRAAQAEGRQGRIHKLFTPATARTQGTARAGEFANQLISDLVRYMAGSRVTGMQDDPHVPAAPVATTAWGAVAREMIAAMDVHAAPYPDHMIPSVLARPLTFSVPGTSPESSRDRAGSSEIRGASVPLSQALKRHHRLVVLGGPGSGKSTALLGETLRRLRENGHAVFVRLSDIASELAVSGAPTTPLAAVRLALHVACREIGAPLGSEDHQSRSFAEDRDALIALDGLDEIDPAGGRRISAMLRHLDDLPGQIVISSRKPGYSRPVGEWNELVSDPLPPEYAGAFLDSWFEGSPLEQSERAKQSLVRDGMTQLTLNPVLLGMVATVASEEEVPRQRSGLYDRYIEIVLQRTWRPRGEWREAATDVFSRSRVAAEIAWLGATGGASDATESTWIDTVSLTFIEESPATVDLTVAQDLLENDVLLSPHGKHISKLRQQYLWAHRTVQEHLTATHLLRLKADNPADWRRQVRLLMLGPLRWYETLKQVAQRLNEVEQVDLLAQMTRVAEEFDPGGVVSEVALMAISQLPENSRARRSAARWAAARNKWGYVDLLDQEVWRAEWPKALFSGKTDPSGASYRGEQIGPPEWVSEFIFRARDSPVVDRSTFIQLLSRIGPADSELAFALYLEALQMGGEGVLARTSFPNIPEESIDKLLECGRSLEPRSWISFLHSLLLCSDRDAGWSRIERAVDRGVLIYLLSFDVDSSSNNTSLFDDLKMEEYFDVASGHFGSRVAYDFGWHISRMLASNSSLNPVYLTQDMPYAVLGSNVHELLGIDISSGEESVCLDGASLLLASSPQDLKNLRALPRYFDAARECAINANQLELSIALEIFRRFLEHEKVLLQKDDWPARVAAHSIKYLFLRILEIYPLKSIVDSIMVNDPKNWPSTQDGDYWAVDLSGILATRAGLSAVTADILAQLFIWAGREGMSVRTNVLVKNVAVDIDTVATRVWRFAPAALLLPTNASWFGLGLREQGTLHKWIDQLTGGASRPEGRVNSA